MTVEAEVRQDGDWWTVEIRGWGVTQVEDPDDVEAMVRDYVSLVGDIDPATLRIGVIHITA